MSGKTRGQIRKSGAHSGSVNFQKQQFVGCRVKMLELIFRAQSPLIFWELLWSNDNR